MTLLTIIQDMGFIPVRTSSTHGGEFHLACPSCGGKDRFIVWPEKDRYWCRQCKKSGDSVQFLRDFQRISYQDACRKVGIQPKKQSNQFNKICTSFKFLPALAEFPPNLWQKSAAAFMLECHEELMINMTGMNLLLDRGFALETIKSFKLGYNPANQFLSMSDWGLPVTHTDKGHEKKLWLPSGIVIPTFLGECISKLKIRRSAWEQGDKHPKYVEVSGSMRTPSIFGNRELKTIVLVEAELDAALVQQTASDLCCPIALGGASKKPDLKTDELLRQASVVFFALDWDEAGKKSYQFWKSTYPQVKPWPVPIGKSPGDALKLGVDLRKWIEEGIEKYH